MGGRLHLFCQLLVILGGTVAGCSRLYYYPLRQEGERVYFEQGSSQSFAPAFRTKTEDFLALDLANRQWAFVTKEEAHGPSGQPATKPAPIPLTDEIIEKNRQAASTRPELPPLDLTLSEFRQLVEKKLAQKVVSVAVDRPRGGAWCLDQGGVVWFVSLKAWNPTWDGGPGYSQMDGGWSVPEHDLEPVRWGATDAPLAEGLFPTLRPGQGFAGPHFIWFTPQGYRSLGDRVEALVLLSVEDHRAEVVAIPAETPPRWNPRRGFFIVGDELCYLLKTGEGENESLVRRRPEKPGEEEVLADVGHYHHSCVPRDVGAYLVLAFDERVMLVNKEKCAVEVLHPPDRRQLDRFLDDLITGPPQAAFQVIYAPLFFIFGNWG